MSRLRVILAILLLIILVVIGAVLLDIQRTKAANRVKKS